MDAEMHPESSLDGTNVARVHLEHKAELCLLQQVCRSIHNPLSLLYT